MVSHNYISTIRLNEPNKDVNESGLSRSIVADQACRLPSPDIHAYSFQNLRVLILLGNILNL